MPVRPAVVVQRQRIGEEATVGRRDDAAEGIDELDAIERHEARRSPRGEDLDAENRPEGRAIGEKAAQRGERAGRVHHGRRGLLPGELEAEVRPGEGRLGLVKGNHLPEVELRDAWSGPEQHGLAVRGGGNGEPVGTSSAGGR